ncbi:MAG: hypothetical protein ABJH07_05290 [Sedimentitalea sp.]|uniref:hypothetical protein n=1 Tax=Sedimentitalea sp. TaxID=2048915 RepID=UPI0032662C99
MSYATLAPSVDERRFGVIGMFIRSAFGQLKSQRDPVPANQGTGAMSEPELADIGHARGVISGTSQQAAGSR